MSKDLNENNWIYPDDHFKGFNINFYDPKRCPHKIHKWDILVVYNSRKRETESLFFVDKIENNKIFGQYIKILYSENIKVDGSIIEYIEPTFLLLKAVKTN